VITVFEGVITNLTSSFLADSVLDKTSFKFYFQFLSFGRESFATGVQESVEADA